MKDNKTKPNEKNVMSFIKSIKNDKKKRRQHENIKNY
jgi:hypothetical protein